MSFDTIASVVGESLDCDPKALTATTSLVEDLGATSLDFVDLLFLLEDRFGLKLQGETFDFLTKVGMTQSEAVVDGVLTPEATARLRSWLPTLPADEGVPPAALYKYVTLATLQALVERAKT